MPKQRIRRTGGHPLIFDGELLCRLDNRRSNLVERKYWHEIAVYGVLSSEPPDLDPGKTIVAQESHPGTRYCVKITFLSTQRGEEPHEWAAVGPRPAALLAAYDPLAGIAGYPPDERYAASQELLRGQVRQAWEELVAALVAQFSQGGEVEP